MAKIIETAAERISILTKYRRIAMVGLSANPYRPSYFAAIYMQAQGYRIIPINPTAAEILGERSYPSLSAYVEEAREPLELVDIFRKPQDVPGVVTEALALGAPVIWMQLGIVHREAAEEAVRSGADVVMNRCVKIEHARFYGGLHTIGLDTGILTSRILPYGR